MGDKIYVPSDLFLDHGRDDRIGGIAMIAKVSVENRGGKNYHIVEVKEFPGVFYNWELALLPEQARLKQRFGKKMAHYSPDERNQFN